MVTFHSYDVGVPAKTGFMPITLHLFRPNEFAVVGERYPAVMRSDAGVILLPQKEAKAP